MRILAILSFVCLHCLTSFSQTNYVFFGSYNRDSGTDGIYVYSFDTSSGILTKVSSSNFVFNPSFLTLSPNGKCLYACTESQTKNKGSVSKYSFDSVKGSLQFLFSHKCGGENPVYLCTDKAEKFLINANYTESSVTVYLAQTDDTFCQRIEFHGKSIRANRQASSHIHSCVFSPDEKYMFFPDLGSDKIWIYHFDSSKLQPLMKDSFIETIPGSGPRHMVFHPNGKFAYCSEELSGSISVYAYSNGKLQSLQRIFSHPISYRGQIMSSDIHISPDGKYLYISNRGDQDNIAIFSIGNDGILELNGYQSTYGIHPRIFALDADGKFLIVGNMLSGNVIVFKRDIETGYLKKVGNEIHITNVSMVIFRKY